MREAPPSAGLCLEGPLPVPASGPPETAASPPSIWRAGALDRSLAQASLMCMGDPGGQPCPLPHGRWWQPGPPLPPENNHSHFILVDPGTPGKVSEPAELRLRLEKPISEQRTGDGGEACLGAQGGCQGTRDGGGHSVWTGLEGPPGRAGKGIPG